MRIFTSLIALIITTSASAQVFVEPCMDLEEIDFGFCDMAMGVAVVGGECVYVSGCGWEVGGIDYSPAFYTSFESCEEGCLEAPGCIDVAGLDFGECLAVLGIANVGGNCTWVSGCSTYFDGVDYSFAFYESIEDCDVACFPEPGGCTYSVALNFNPNATFDDGSCLFPECVSDCAGDLNGDDSVTVEDILQLLSTFGLICN
jgi:hypothetical protein